MIDYGLTCFNTSHVTLYHPEPAWCEIKNTVSIHLMLLFIDMRITLRYICITFQYISCYSLSSRGDHILDYENWFQYISCYSLSVKKNGVWIEQERFNTSHVTLYRLRENKMVGIKALFQYISCYSLSMNVL